jgi:hypothetical protein
MVLYRSIEFIVIFEPCGFKELWITIDRVFYEPRGFKELGTHNA